MAFSFRRNGYINKGKETVTAIGLMMGGYQDNEVLNQMYESPTKAIATANKKLATLGGTPPPKPRKIQTKEPEPIKPIVTSEEEEDEEYKAWYATFISWVKGFLNYDQAK